MGLNISKGNMYPWINFTWNTVKGACPHDCSYCYMKKWGTQKPIRFDEKELKEFERDMRKYGERQFIFVGSSCDMFANDIEPEWIAKTLYHCCQFNNTYFFQSKDPDAFLGWGAAMPEKVIFCTTIETNRVYEDIMGKTPFPYNRAVAMLKLSEFVDTYVTIEPIMDFDLDKMIQLVLACGAKQVNIGADSGNNNLPEPSRDKIFSLIEILEQFTVVKQKKNLNRLLKHKP